MCGAAQGIREAGALICEVDAWSHDPLRIRWQKNGVALVDEGRTSGSATGRLKINPFLDQDAGVFEAVVMNDYGGLTSRVEHITAPLPLMPYLDLKFAASVPVTTPVQNSQVRARVALDGSLAAVSESNLYLYDLSVPSKPVLVAAYPPKSGPF